MENDTNGSTMESPTSSLLLMRKGLFGKSGNSSDSVVEEDMAKKDNNLDNPAEIGEDELISEEPGDDAEERNIAEPEPSGACSKDDNDAHCLGHSNEANHSETQIQPSGDCVPGPADKSLNINTDEVTGNEDSKDVKLDDSSNVPDTENDVKHQNPESKGLFSCTIQEDSSVPDIPQDETKDRLNPSEVTDETVPLVEEPEESSPPPVEEDDMDDEEYVVDTESEAAPAKESLADELAAANNGVSLADELASSTRETKNDVPSATYNGGDSLADELAAACAPEPELPAEDVGVPPDPEGEENNDSVLNDQTNECASESDNKEADVQEKEDPPEPEVEASLDEGKGAAEEADDEEQMNSPKADNDEDEVEPATPRSARGRRAAKIPASTASSTTRASRSSAKSGPEESSNRPTRVSSRKNELTTPKAPSTPETACKVEEQPTTGRGRARGSAKKIDEKKFSPEEHETENETPRRALRTRKEVPTPAAVAETKTPKAKTAASDKRKESVSEDVETVEGTPKAKRGRRSVIDKEKAAAETVVEESSRSARRKTSAREVGEEKSPSKVTPKPKKAFSTSTPTLPKPPKPVKSKSEGHDPYDIDTEIEHHPEPLKHIKMAVQSFGSVKYEKTGSGRYEQTEKTAEQRTGNLSDLVPKSKSRHSLGDLTPTVGRRTATNVPKSAPPVRGRKSRALKDSEEHEEMDVDTPSKTPKSGRKRKATSPISTPAKKQELALPELNDDELWTVDHPADEHVPHEAGARVYASFQKIYYPAIVTPQGRDNLGRYNIHFIEDDVVKDVPAAGVIPLRAVVAEKHCLLSLNGDISAVEVVQSPNAASAKEWKKAAFKVVQIDEDGNAEGGAKEVSWTDLRLELNEWMDYVNRISKAATSVAAENISSSGRASRRSHAASEIIKTPTKLATPKSAGSSVKRGRGRQTQATEPENDSIEDSKATTLFDGMMFILTSAIRGNPQESSTFKKKMMSDFILQCNGIVFEDFKEVDANPDKKAFLISDTHYRTHKYLSAMARGVPCVSHEWIHKCRDTNTLVDYREYLLPAGISLLNEKVYSLPSKQNQLLKGKKVLVHSNHQPTGTKTVLNFVQIWQPIVQLLGGNLVHVDDDSKLDVLLTDQSASPEILDRAKEDGAVIASSEWIIQGIIMDKLPDVNAHPKFKYDGVTAPAQRS